MTTLPGASPAPLPPTPHTKSARIPFLPQVEYAIEAINQAGACIGLLATDGVVLVAEKKITSKLLDAKAVGVKHEKMYQLDHHIACAVAGITSDANILINSCRQSAQQYLYTYQNPMPVEQLVKAVSDKKHAYTQFGGQRPFGISMLYMGWDKDFGYQLFQSDPSGNYGGWKASAIGANHQTATNLLKQDYKEEMSLEEATELGLKTMARTMDSTELAVDKLEVATLTRVNDKVVFKIWKEHELQPLLDKVNQEKKEKDDAEE